MRHRGWVFAACCAVGCFADPPAGGESSEGSSTMAATGTVESTGSATSGDTTSVTATAVTESTVADETGADASTDATDTESSTSNTTNETGPAESTTGEPPDCAVLDMCLDCVTCSIGPNGACEDLSIACGLLPSCFQIAQCIQQCGQDGVLTVECHDACMTMGSPEDQGAAYELLQCSGCETCISPCEPWADICALPAPAG